MSGKALDYSGWYGVRCVFRLLENEDGHYEERVTLWQAQSFDHAHELAKQEARRYAVECRAEFLDHSDAYWIDPEIFELDAEVFSLLRESDLASAEYISTFYSTGREHGCRGRPSASGDGGLEWYGVRCLFWWSGWESQAFEERITLWQAISASRAADLAEQEAREYVQDSGIEYLGFSQVSGCTVGGDVREGMVAFSLVRDSCLSPDDYITAFFNTGRERVRPDRDN
ncbi:MAG: hypothetical protein ACRD22_18115 [Terriglobia bacterium]